MSTLNPHPVSVELAGQEHTLMFNLGTIYGIQNITGMSIFDAAQTVAQAADGDISNETAKVYRQVLQGLTGLSEDEINRAIDMTNYVPVAVNVMRAYGITIPEPDEDAGPNPESRPESR